MGGSFFIGDGPVRTERREAAAPGRIPYRFGHRISQNRVYLVLGSLLVSHLSLIASFFHLLICYLMCAFPLPYLEGRHMDVAVKATEPEAGAYVAAAAGIDLGGVA